MDKTQLIKWLVPIVVRGLAWIFAARLGMTAVESGDLAQQVGTAIGALILAGVSIYTSVKGRNALLKTTPPAK